MADRSVSVFLRANITGYTAALEKAKLQTRDFARDTAKSAQTHGQAWDKVGKGMLLTGGLMAAGLGLAVKAAMEFDAQMAQIKSLSGATANEMKKLEQSAKKTGQAFGISASEAADAETELVKAGISVKDILGGGLQGALTLAADGQMNVADATSIAASSMVQFGLAGKDIPHIADLLAAGADKALGSVGDLGQALTSSGTVAHQWGLSLEQTVGTLAEFAAAGQTGERGGTLLRQMLLQLTTASGPAAALMEKYGFSVKTAGGGLADTAEIAARLQKSFGGLDVATRTHALGVIFGAHAIQGANILMADGAKVNLDWTKKVNDSGFAADQASKKMDSLAGDLQKLKASFQTALIDTGQQATGALRGLTKGATGVINVFDDLSPVMKTAIVDLGGVVAVTAIVGGTALVAIPKVVAFKAALAELGLTAKATAGSLEAAAGAEGAAAGAGRLGALLRMGAGAGPVAAVVAGVTIGTDLSVSATNSQDAKQTKDLAGSPAKLAAARAELAKLQSRVATAGTSLGPRSGTVTGAQVGRIEQLKKEIAGATAAMKANATAAPGMAAGETKVGAAATGGALSVADFDAAIKRLSGRFDIRSETDAMIEGFRQLGKQAKESGHAVHGNSDAAIANRTALTQQYQAALGIIQTYKDQGHGAEDVKKKTADVTDQFITQAQKAGFTKTQIQNYIDALHKVPAKIPQPKVGVTGAQKAIDDMAALNRQMSHFRTAGSIALVGVRNKQAARDPQQPYTGGLITPYGLVKRSQGGPVWGAGTATSDSIPAMLSAGEYVINAASAAAIGTQTLHALNRYSTGGSVTGGAPAAGLRPVQQTNNYYGIRDPERLAGLTASRMAWAVRG